MPFVIEPRAYDDPDVVRLVAQVQQEYVEMYGGPDEAAVDTSEFADPMGLMLVGVLDGEAVATGGWRRLAEASTAEIKRMYVVPSARRRGLARAMLGAVEQTAARAGVTTLVLNTGPVQHAAIAMYRAAGYEDCPPFGHYACHGDALFFAKSLVTSAV